MVQDLNGFDEVLVALTRSWLLAIIVVASVVAACKVEEMQMSWKKSKLRNKLTVVWYAICFLIGLLIFALIVGASMGIMLGLAAALAWMGFNYFLWLIYGDNSKK